MSKHVQGVNAGSVGSSVARSGVAMAALLVLAAGASAQWLPDYQRYEVKRAGLFDALHTHPVTGEQDSAIFERDSLGRFAGWSTRYGTGYGLDAWYWDGQTTHLINFGGPDHFTSIGNHWTHAKITDETGLVAGEAQRYTTTGGTNGYDAWGWKNGVVVQISPGGGPYRGSAGFQKSAIVQTLWPRVPGLILGTTDRITGVSTINGKDTWVWDGNVVRTLGFSGPGYTTATGFQFAEATHISSNGVIAGYSTRVTPAGVSDGASAWVWSNSAIVEVGLMGPEYSGSAGYRYNRPSGITSSTQALGLVRRVLGVSTHNGEDAWVTTGGVTTRIGLAEAVHTGSNGYRSTAITGYNDAGDVVGYTQRTTGVNTNNGNDAWIWRNGVTTQIGLVGPGYTSSNGYQWSRPIQVALNEAGQVKGHSERVLESGVKNGQDAWVWKDGVLSQVGLTGGINEGSAGYRFARLFAQNDVGQVVGDSVRVADVSTNIGQDVWFWNGTTSVRIGLSGGPYIGVDGLQYNVASNLNEHGQVDGATRRYLGGSVSKGTNAWVWNGGETKLLGFVGADYTRGDGYQKSTIPTGGRTPSGVIVGQSTRYNDAEDENGQDTWYFDPATGITHDVLAGVPGRVRALDGYAYSELGKLTEEGVLFGTYRYFQDGAGVGEDRAFVYRPDLGFEHLESLVVNGIGAYGWDALQNAEHAVGFDTFVGYGRTTGQTTEGRRIFVLTEIECVADFDDNGIPSIDDLFLYFNAWFQGQPSADVNGQVGVTIDDLFFFINAWFMGC